jgi:hypothetical protein
MILAAASHPPRIGETRPLAALMPQVLALYGLAGGSPCEKTADITMIDLLA